MYINSSAPNAKSLGSVNGIAQTTVALSRAFGPAASTSLFAFSSERQIMGGNFVYLVMMCVPVIAATLGTKLPRNP